MDPILAPLPMAARADGLESVLDGPCKKISGFGSPNGLQNGVQNGSRNGFRAISGPTTYKRRKHYYSNAKWLWVPLLIHRFSLKIQPKLVPKLVPKRVPFRNLVFKFLLVGSRYKTLPNHPVTNFLEKWVPICGPILNKIVKQTSDGN